MHVAGPKTLRESSQRIFASLDDREVEIVARAVLFAERKHLTGVARIATRLGNGWLYPILSALIVLAQIDKPLRFLTSSAISLLIAFGVYPALKRSLARMRPCDYYPSLARAVEPLDHYSCPSGHAMTAAAFAVSLVAAWPAAAALAASICLVIGWSRVALGHHYVSDVVLGSVMGAAIAAPIALIVI